MSAMIQYATVAAGFLALTGYALPDLPFADETAPRFEVIATDSSGDSYVAGSGDDCSTAWDNAVLPSDWREIICVPAAR